MAKQGISTGSSPNDGSGDSLLQGAIKINSNFNEIYNAIGNGINITNTIAFANTAYNISTSANIRVGFATVYDLDVGIGGSSLIVTNDGIIAFGTNTTSYKLEIYQKSVRIHDSSVHATGNSSIGIGTTNPGEKLQVDGNIRVGISTTSNYIAFRGTYADDQVPYTHTYMGERIWDPGSERSELLLFKGNDANTFSGPDRIRLAGGQIRLDTYPSGTFVAGSFAGVATDPNIINRVVVHSTGEVGIGTDVLTGTASQPLQVTGGAYVSGSVGIGTTNPTSKLHVLGGDIRVGIDTSSGLILTSQNGTRFRLLVSNTGVLSTVQI